MVSSKTPSKQNPKWTACQTWYEVVFFLNVQLSWNQLWCPSISTHCWLHLKVRKAPLHQHDPPASAIAPAPCATCTFQHSISISSSERDWHDSIFTVAMLGTHGIHMYPHIYVSYFFRVFHGLPIFKKNYWVHGILLPAIGNEQGIMKRHRRTIKNWWNCPRLTVSSRQTSTLPSDMQPATVQVVECLGCPGAVPVGVESRCSCRIQTQN